MPEISTKFLLKLVTIATDKGSWFQFVSSLLERLSILLHFASDEERAGVTTPHKQFKPHVNQPTV